MAEITLQVGASADDGHFTGTTWYSSGAFISVGDFEGGVRSLFARFTNVPIAKGARINSAKIQYLSNAANTGTDCITKIYFNDEDNASAPTSVATYNGKSVTTEYVDWTISAWDDDTWYDSPDIKAVVQEVIDRASWSSGNAMMLLHKNNGSATNARRSMYAYDQTGNVSGAKLVIDYTYPKTLTATVSASATVTKKSGKILSAITNIASTLTRGYVFYKILSIAVTAGVTLTKKAGKIITAVVNTSAAASKAAHKTISVILNASVTVNKKAYKALTATASVSANIIKNLSKTLTATVNVLTGISKRGKKALTSTVNATAVVRLPRDRIRYATATITERNKETTVTERQKTTEVTK